MEGGSKSGNSLIRGRCGRLDRWPALVPSRRPWSGPTAARSRAAGLVRRRFRGRWLPKVNGTRPAASGITQLTPSPRSTRLPLPDLVRTQPPARRPLRSPRRALKGFARIDPPTLGIAGWSSAGTAFQLGDRTMLLSPDHLPTRGVARWSSARTTSNSKRRSPLLNPDHPPTRGGAPWSSARTIDQLGGSHPAPQPGPPRTRSGAPRSSTRTTHQLGASHPAPQPGPSSNPGRRTLLLNPDHPPTRGVAPRSSTRTTRQLRESRRLPARAPSPLRTRDDRPSALFPTGPRESPGLLRCRAPRGQTKLCACERSPSDVAPTERTDSHGSPPLPRTSPRSPPLRSTVNHPTEPRGAQFFS